MTFANMEAVMAANRKLGHFFFGADTMEFFKSRIESGLYGGRYFITSEQNSGSRYNRHTGEYENYDYGRDYAVRRANPDGSIDTVCDYRRFPTKDAAEAAVEEIVAAEAAEHDRINAARREA